MFMYCVLQVLVTNIVFLSVCFQNLLHSVSDTLNSLGRCLHDLFINVPGGCCVCMYMYTYLFIIGREVLAGHVHT